MGAEPELESTSIARSIHMLKLVLDGSTYEAVARQNGLTRTAIERRVKDLARQLIRAAGIAGLNEDNIGFVRRLRAHRDGLLQALDRIEAGALAIPHRGQAIRVYSTEEIVAAADRVRAYSQQPLRDVALFLLLFASGASPLEIARLRVGDYLEAGGEVRRISELRADVAINGAARPLHFASTRLNTVLLPYVLERADADRQDQPYRGLDPDQPLFLAAGGHGFQISAYVQGGQHRFLCRPILETYRRIFRHARLPGGGSPRAVRATIASRLYARGADDGDVGLLLGIAQRSSVRQRFPRTKPTFRELVEELI